MTMPRALIIALIAPILAAGCAARPFHSHFEAGRFEEAARAFEEDPSLLRDQRALLRAAIVYADPASPAHDPERARELLDRLIEERGDGEYARHARWVLAFLDELGRREEEARRLQMRVDSLISRIAALEAESHSLQQLIARERLHADAFRALAERLQAELRRTEEELRGLQENLRQLKEVDLQRLGAGGLSGGAAPPAANDTIADDTTTTRPVNTPER